MQRPIPILQSTIERMALSMEIPEPDHHRWEKSVCVKSDELLLTQQTWYGTVCVPRIDIAVCECVFTFSVEVVSVVTEALLSPCTPPQQNTLDTVLKVKLMVYS